MIFFLLIILIIFLYIFKFFFNFDIFKSNYNGLIYVTRRRQFFVHYFGLKEFRYAINPNLFVICNIFETTVDKIKINDKVITDVKIGLFKNNSKAYNQSKYYLSDIEGYNREICVTLLLHVNASFQINTVMLENSSFLNLEREKYENLTSNIKNHIERTERYDILNNIQRIKNLMIYTNESKASDLFKFDSIHIQHITIQARIDKPPFDILKELIMEPISF